MKKLQGQIGSCLCKSRSGGYIFPVFRIFVLEIAREPSRIKFTVAISGSVCFGNSFFLRSQADYYDSQGGKR